MIDSTGPYHVTAKCPKCGQLIESPSPIQTLDAARDRAYALLASHKYSCPKEAKETTYEY